ncbi:MAG TPA: D-aminoacylase [Bacillota bacterium]|nr:D-aminoacylase [Bacillota bacterium]
MKSVWGRRGPTGDASLRAGESKEQELRRKADMGRLLLRDAKIVDGTGRPWFWGDVALKDGIIVDIGRGLTASGARVIDLCGLVLAPGFIDIHSHSDDTVLINPLAESKIRQGITTEVIGNCGYSPAPLEGEAIDSIRRDLDGCGITPDWSSFGEYLHRIEDNGTAVNIAALIGHGTIRQAVIGCEERKPYPEELAYMKKLVSRSMDEGAFGISTGLIYPPSCYADTDEIVELAQIVAGKGGIYATHIRNEGSGVVDATEEAIAIGKRAGVRVEISHHKSGGPENRGKVKETLRIIENARCQGIDVLCDVYPYVASSTGLSVILPNSLFDGGDEKALARLKDKDTLSEIRRQVEEEEGLRLGWDKTVISSVTNEGNKAFEGKSLCEIAAITGKDPFTAAIDLLIDEALSVQVVRFIMCEEDVTFVLSSRLSSIGTDASSMAPYGVLGMGKPHPRAYGTFPRVLGKYVRDMGALRLEEAVRKMTSLPAGRLGILDRGLICPGTVADLVAFDPDTVEDIATYTDPHRYPLGIMWVIVSGTPVVEQGEHTGLLPGKVLRHNRR